MNPGKLDRRITLQVRVVSKDATGSRVETWADSATVCAELVQARGSEAVKADSDRYQTSQQFRIRHREINPADFRVYYKSRFYDIQSVTEEGRRNSLLLDTVATQALT